MEGGRGWAGVEVSGASVLFLACGTVWNRVTGKLSGWRSPAEADGGGGHGGVIAVLSMPHVRDILTAKTNLYVFISHSHWTSVRLLLFLTYFFVFGAEH